MDCYTCKYSTPLWVYSSDNKMLIECEFYDKNLVERSDCAVGVSFFASLKKPVKSTSNN